MVAPARLMGRVSCLGVGFGAVLACALLPGTASACRVALAMGLDVSASVDAREYRLQLDGVAAALNAPVVRDALFLGPGGPVAVAVYEWSGWEDQRLLVDWTLLTGPEALAAVTGRLMTTERREMSDSTALGMAVLSGAELLRDAPSCARHVLDISGDGKNNDGADPDMLDGDSVLAGVTVNALVIGADDRAEGDRRAVSIGELSSYFNAYVIRGPDAFVQVALGFADYERAMTRKLLRELQPAAMSAIDPGAPGSAPETKSPAQSGSVPGASYAAARVQGPPSTAR